MLARFTLGKHYVSKCWMFDVYFHRFIVCELAGIDYCNVQVDASHRWIFMHTAVVCCVSMQQLKAYHKWFCLASQ